MLQRKASSNGLQNTLQRGGPVVGVGAAARSREHQHTMLLAHVTQSSVYNESVFLVLLHLRGYIIEGLRRCRERQRPLHLLRLLGQEVGVLLWEGEVGEEV